jgi:hypothetical protein
VAAFADLSIRGGGERRFRALSRRKRQYPRAGAQRRLPPSSRRSFLTQALHRTKAGVPEAAFFFLRVYQAHASAIGPTQ